MPQNPETNFPSFRDEVGKRLREVEKRFRNRDEAAKAAGVAKSTFQRWVEGKADPSFEGLAKLALATDISLDWLASGRGASTDERAAPAEAAVPLDEDLLGRVFEGIRGVYKEQGGRISDRDAGILAARFYADLVASCDDPDERRGGLKAMLQQLRRDIRATPATDQGKRLA